MTSLRDLRKIDLDYLESPAYNTGITKFIDSRLDALSTIAGFQGELRRRVQDRLQERWEGCFLWLGCVIEELKEKKTYTDLVRCLKTFLAGLCPLYDRLLAQINEDCRPECARILQWIAQAMRPLTITELADAIDLQEEDEIPRELSIQDRITWCGSLLRVHKPEGQVEPLSRSSITP